MGGNKIKVRSEDSSSMAMMNMTRLTDFQKQLQWVQYKVRSR